MKNPLVGKTSHCPEFQSLLKKIFPNKEAILKHRPKNPHLRSFVDCIRGYRKMDQKSSLNNMCMETNHINHIAFLGLKKLGYPVVNIRKSFHKLTGVGQPEMAEMIGTSRINVTKNIDGSRNTPDVREGISKIWGVPVDDLWEPAGDKAGKPEMGKQN